ncbi:hypothetical protein Hanom_Chr13g01215471 [Helianthus anomalus]
MLTQHRAWSTLRFTESEIVEQVQLPRAVPLTHEVVLVQDLTLQLMRKSENEGHRVVPGGHQPCELSYFSYKYGCLVSFKSIPWQTTSLILATTPPPLQHQHPPPSSIFHLLECVVVSGSKIDRMSSCQTKTMLG